MLINVRSDVPFQRFLDRQEQALHVKMVPIVYAGIRMTINRGSINASEAMVKRAENVLVAHSKRVYREIYRSINPARFAKQIDDDEDPEGINEFMEDQLAALTMRASRSATEIAHSLSGDIRDAVFDGMQEGWGLDRIEREIVTRAPDLSRWRAATIARTETHGAAMEAMDEAIDFKSIEIAQKRWWTAQDHRVRPSHYDLHDLAIPNDQSFVIRVGPNAGDELDFPGDDSHNADAGEIINCRCVLLYETPEEAERRALIDENGD